MAIAIACFFTDKTRTVKNYFVSLQYIYADKVYTDDFTIPYQDKLLTVKLTTPDAVYPGQHAEVKINVSNAEGAPVADADVTAWSFTKKFTEAKPPYVPYLGTYYPGRKRYANFTAGNENEHSHSIKLAWQRWSKELKLDTIEYFKFLHPQSLYVNTEAAPDSITQVAPFVIIDGDLQPVHHIYIDEVPYFSAVRSRCSVIVLRFPRASIHSAFVHRTK